MAQTMKAVLLSLALVCVWGCSHAPAVRPAPDPNALRSALDPGPLGVTLECETALSSVSRGMGKDQVQSVLGQPDKWFDAVTSFQNPVTYRFWEYHLVDGTTTVAFDGEGRVAFGSATPNDEGLRAKYGGGPPSPGPP